MTGIHKTTHEIVTIVINVGVNDDESDLDLY